MYKQNKYYKFILLSLAVTCLTEMRYLQFSELCNFDLEFIVYY